MFLTCDSWVFVLVYATNVWRAFQVAFQVVGPRVIRANNCALGFAFFLHQLHAAVAAYIVEDLENAVVVTHEQQWHSHEINGLDIAVLGYIAGIAYTHPSLPKHAVTFVPEVRTFGVEIICQPIGLVNWLQHTCQRLDWD